MAHFVEPSRLERQQPQTPDQFRTWEHVKGVFGREPSSIRLLSEAGTQPGVCIVKVCSGLRDALEFICAGGLLVGIPSKGRGRK